MARIYDWDEIEIAQLLEMWRDDPDRSRISAELGRTPEAISGKLRDLRRQLGAKEVPLHRRAKEPFTEAERLIIETQFKLDTPFENILALLPGRTRWMLNDEVQRLRCEGRIGYQRMPCQSRRQVDPEGDVLDVMEILDRKKRQRGNDAMIEALRNAGARFTDHPRAAKPAEAPVRLTPPAAMYTLGGVASGQL